MAEDDEQLRELMQDLHVASQTIAKLEADMEQVCQECASLEEQKEVLVKSLQAKSSECDKFEGDCIMLAEKMRQVKDQVVYQNVRQSEDELKKALASNNALTATVQELQAAVKQNSASSSEINVLKAEQATLQAKMTEAETGRVADQVKIKELSAALASQKKEFESDRSQMLADMNVLAGAQATQRDALTRMHEQAEKASGEKLLSMTAERNSLKQTVDSVRKEMEKMMKSNLLKKEEQEDSFRKEMSAALFKQKEKHEQKVAMLHDHLVRTKDSLANAMEALMIPEEERLKMEQGGRLELKIISSVKSKEARASLSAGAVPAKVNAAVDSSSMAHNTRSSEGKEKDDDELP